MTSLHLGSELYKPGDRPLFERISTLRKLGGYAANT